MEENQKNLLLERPPVVVVLGHVDHGKSSLLEAIKDFKITQKESGGITQHIGAYEVEHNGKKITFIDTPGHEAFWAMRSRGANIADIALLVVAAEEGVKPQTKEAIECIKKANIQSIVVINKIDKPEANAQKVKGELAKIGIVVEGMGGEIPSVETSATQKIGIDDLLEMILLLSEMKNLKTDLAKPAQGAIIETRVDAQRGQTATLLVQDGILRIQDVIATKTVVGKIKKMEDFQGNPVEEAGASKPVIALGFEEMPYVGEAFKIFPDLEKAREYAIKKEKANEVRMIITEEGQKVFNIILKADVAGSLEAIEGMIKALPQNEIFIRILKAEVGEIVDDDVQLAIAGKAKIFGFRVRPDSQTLKLINQKGVDVITHEIVYELIQDIRRRMKASVETEIVRKELGKMNVLKIFMTEKNRQIVGGAIIEGEVIKGAKLEVFREDSLIGRGKIIELQREKKVIEKGRQGDEVGILYEGDVRIQEGDILNFYIEEKKKSEL